MEVEGTVWAVEQRRGHDLAVIGEDDEIRREGLDLRDRIGIAQPIWREDRADLDVPGSVVDGRRGRTAAPARRSRWGRDDPDELDVRVLAEPPQTFAAEPAAAEEDGACPSSRHARALVASRTSASSSSPWPTGISSSIESR